MLWLHNNNKINLNLIWAQKMLPENIFLDTTRLQWPRLPSKKATNFCKISTVDLSYVVPVKSTVDISQNFVAVSEYMKFNKN